MSSTFFNSQWPVHEPGADSGEVEGVLCPEFTSSISIEHMLRGITK